ncbi:MAG: hypothetical protein U9P90_01380, partial [Patescibacteria group bacterium]|nr:hypothetical protein [Patescibacteria group bacterium]
MDFVLPTISIDFSWFEMLGQQSFLGIMWTLFIYGGWIPLVYIFIWGGLQVWLYQRRLKYAKTLNFVTLAIDVPKNTEQTPKAVENIFNHLQGAKSSINFKEKWWDGHFWTAVSLELISIEGYVQFLVNAQSKFRNVVEAAFYAQYPNIEIVEVEDYSRAVPGKYPDKDYEWWGTEIKLKKSFAYPIRTYPDFEDKVSGEFKDPLSNFLESIAKLGKGEQFWMQILIVPGGDSLFKEGEKIVDKISGRKREQKTTLLQKVLNIPVIIISEAFNAVFGPAEEFKKPEKKEGDMFKMFNLTPLERKTLEDVEYKASKPAFDAKIRWVYYAKKEVFSVGNIYGHIKGFMKQYVGSNMLGTDPRTITKGDYFWQKWDVPRRKRMLMQNYRDRDIWAGLSSYILNTEELATLYHFPAIEVKAPLVKKAESKRAEPPFT